MGILLKEIVNVITDMKTHGVVLYGAGKRGEQLLKNLITGGIRIEAVADQQKGKKLGEFSTISLDELCLRANQEVCIITPMIPLPYETDKLKKAYKIVLDSSTCEAVITWMSYFVPQEDYIDYTVCHPFNHYDSPYVSKMEVESHKKMIEQDRMQEIDFNFEEQQSFFNVLAKYTGEFPAEGGGYKKVCR